MGYKARMLPVAEFGNGATLRMENSPSQIREVKVTSERIRQNDDTLPYSVSGFRMPQDRRITALPMY